MPALRAVAYYRKSNDDDGGSIDQQRDWARPACEREGVEIVREFADQSKPGWDTIRRTAFHEMLDFCKAEAKAGRPVQAVVCWHTNRFSRADSQETASFVWGLRQAGVSRMLTATRWLDFDRAEDRLLFGVEQDFSNNPYARDLAQAATRGRLAAAKDGRFIGGPVALGYRKAVGADGKLRLVLGPDEEVELLRWIFRTYADTRLGMRAIANALTERGVPTSTGRSAAWSKDTVREILVNPVYLGRLVWNRRSEGRFVGVVKAEAVLRPGDGRRVTNARESWVWADDATHEPLIDLNLFDRCQAKMAGRSVAREGGKRGGRNPGKPSAFLLTGLVRCAECGGAMVGQSCPSTRDGEKYVHRIYLCSRYLRGGKSACHWNGVNAQALDLAVALKLKARWLNRELLQAVREEIRRQDAEERGDDPGRLKGAKDRLKAAERKVSQAAGRMLEEEDDALLPALRQRMQELVAQRDALAAEVEELGRRGPAASADAEADVDAAIAWAERLDAALETGDADELRTCLQESVACVEVWFNHTPRGKKTRCEFVRAILDRRHQVRMLTPVAASRSCC